MYTPVPEEPFRLPPIIKTSNNNNKQIVQCPKCHRLAEPYKVPGYDHTNPIYYRCTSCSHVDVHFRFIKKDYTGPLGSFDPHDLNKPADYTVVQTKRNIRGKQRDRNSLNRGRNQEVEQIPKIGNREDLELKQLLEHGILLNLNDTEVEDY